MFWLKKNLADKHRVLFPCSCLVKRTIRPCNETNIPITSASVHLGGLLSCILKCSISQDSILGRGVRGRRFHPSGWVENTGRHSHKHRKVLPNLCHVMIAASQSNARFNGFDTQGHPFISIQFYFYSAKAIQLSQVVLIILCLNNIVLIYGWKDTCVYCKSYFG